MLSNRPAEGSRNYRVGNNQRGQDLLTGGQETKARRYLSVPNSDLQGREAIL